jgi:hypothetical protein
VITDPVTTATKTLTAESLPVNFTVFPTTYTFPLTVIKDQDFSLDMGVVSNYNLGTVSLPSTNNNVTATESSGKLILSSATGLATSTSATFGNTVFSFTVREKASGTMMISF